MATTVPARRIAVLIDGDNISPNHAEELFAAVSRFGHCRVRRIYGSAGGEKLKGWAGAIKRHAILVNPGGCGGSGKNATDIMLVIDAMDLLHSGRVDGFCLASADRDFTALALRIREHGLPVFGFCQDEKAAGCREAFDVFTVMGPAKPAPSPSVATKPAKPPAPAAKQPDIAPHVPLIRTVIEELQAGSDSAWVTLSQVCALLRQKHPKVAQKHLGTGKAKGKGLKLLKSARSVDHAIELDNSPAPLVRLKAA